MQIKTKIVSSHTADSELVKQEVNGTVILPPLVSPGLTIPGKLEYLNEEDSGKIKSIFQKIVKILGPYSQHFIFFIRPSKIECHIPVGKIYLSQIETLVYCTHS